MDGGHLVQQWLDQIARAHRHATRGEQHVRGVETVAHRALEGVFVVERVAMPGHAGARLFSGCHQRKAIAIAD